MTINALRAAYRAIFRSTEGHIPDRAAAARKNWAGIAEVQELTDFILADAKQEICTARVRGASGDE